MTAKTLPRAEFAEPDTAAHWAADGRATAFGELVPSYQSTFKDIAQRNGLFASLVISAKVSTIVCVVELATMLGFAILPEEPGSLAAALTDTLLLGIISAPLILLWVIRPYILARNGAVARLENMNRLLRHEIDERMAAEEKLRANEHDLQMQIQEIDYVKQLVEAQAADAVGLAEELAVQKQAVEESERRNEFLANHDTLTGLPNRRHFEQILTQLKMTAQSKNGSVTLIYVDLDNFKTVNDTLGHQRGDELLRQVAEQLRASTRGTDMIARLGGDEFAIVSTQFQPGKDGELQRFAERIRSALAIPVEAESRVIPVTATLGIATYPADATDERQLLQHADRAMYAAKARGRNCVVFYQDLAEAVPSS